MLKETTKMAIKYYEVPEKRQVIAVMAGTEMDA